MSVGNPDVTPGERDPNRAIKILYTNYLGQTAIRTIEPNRLWFGSTDQHPEPQWLIDAFDFDKQAPRTFAAINIRSWFVR